MTEQSDKRHDIGLRIAQTMQKALRDDDGRTGVAFDIVLRNGSIIQCVWQIEIEDGMVRTDSAVSTAKLRGLAYAFPAEDIMLARPHNDMPSAGERALKWGRAALEDHEIKYMLAMRIKSGMQITQIHSIEIDGGSATIGSFEVCDSGDSHIVAVDQVEAVWVESASEGKAD